MRADETNAVANATEQRDTYAPALEFDRVVQDFRLPSGKGSRRVLDTISFAVRRGQFTAIVGPSGCGKSTLLHMAAGLLAPTSGAVRQDGVAITSVNRAVGFGRSRRSFWHGRRCGKTSNCRFCCVRCRATSAPSACAKSWSQRALPGSRITIRISSRAGCRSARRLRARSSIGRQPSSWTSLLARSMHRHAW